MLTLGQRRRMRRITCRSTRAISSPEGRSPSLSSDRIGFARVALEDVDRLKAVPAGVHVETAQLLAAVHEFVGVVDVEQCCALPAVSEYFRNAKPSFLAWGKNGPFFLPAGAEAFKRDIPDAVVRFYDTGHFALETHAAEIAVAIREFLCP
jgi:pimeloyl-ACP methyl ester carboxylesterase